MVDVVLTRQEIRDGTVRELREWCHQLTMRDEEVRETLRNERMYTESAFLHRAADGDYLYYYMEAEDIEDALASFAASDRDVDREHASIMNDVVSEGPSIGEFELLYHAVGPERDGQP